MTAFPGDPARELMCGEPVTVDLGASLREVIDAMANQEVGSVIVSEMGQLVGIITERDIVTAVGDGVNPDAVYAADVMSESPYCADPEDTVSFTVQRMVQCGIQHMPVVRAGRAVGMISARDVLRAVSEKWAGPGGEA